MITGGPFPKSPSDRKMWERDHFGAANHGLNPKPWPDQKKPEEGPKVLDEVALENIRRILE